jgi:hypothetical protein
MSKVRLQFRENDQVLASQFKCVIPHNQEEVNYLKSKRPITWWHTPYQVHIVTRM